MSVFGNPHIIGEAAYNELQYMPLPHFRSHPAHVAAVAHLHGVPTPTVATGRILELGCAGGENLIPHAFFYPEATFVGIDYSRAQVDDATAHVRQLGLTNVDIVQRSIVEMMPSDGLFDVIIAHGFYSWIAADVQEHLMRVCSQNLADNGIVYISYNVLPGWYAKRVVRELMMFHTIGAETQVERLKSSRALLAEIKGTISGSYGAANDTVIGYVERSLDYYVAHEYLGHDNLQCYFSEFTAHAARYGLAWIADTNPALNMSADARAAVEERALRLSDGDPIRCEQYMDFLLGRVFRMSILAKSARAATSSYRPLLERIPDVHFSISSTLSESRIPSPAETFEYAAKGNAGYPLRASDSFEVEVMRKLLHPHYATVSVAQLAADFAGSFGDETMLRERLSILLMKLWQHHLAIPYQNEIRWSGVSEKPRAWDLTRSDARFGRLHTTNILHEPLEFSQPGSREFLMLVDGTRTHAELADEVLRLSERGVIHFDGVLTADNLDHAAAYVEQKLAVYAANEALAPV